MSNGHAKPYLENLPISPHRNPIKHQSCVTKFVQWWPKMVNLIKPDLPDPVGSAVFQVKMFKIIKFLVVKFSMQN